MAQSDTVLFSSRIVVTTLKGKEMFQWHFNDSTPPFPSSDAQSDHPGIGHKRKHAIDPLHVVSATGYAFRSPLPFLTSPLHLLIASACLHLFLPWGLLHLSSGAFASWKKTIFKPWVDSEISFFFVLIISLLAQCNLNWDCHNPPEIFFWNYDVLNISCHHIGLKTFFVHISPTNISKSS